MLSCLIAGRIQTVSLIVSDDRKYLMATRLCPPATMHAIVFTAVGRAGITAVVCMHSRERGFGVFACVALDCQRVSEYLVRLLDRTAVGNAQEEV